MNKNSQLRQIQKFLKGQGNKDVDPFCIYQWIDRCYYEGWWVGAISLSSYVPPNSLIEDYHKRVDFLVNECRKKFNENYEEIMYYASEKLDFRNPSDRLILEKGFEKAGHEIVFSEILDSEDSTENNVKGQKKDIYSITIDGVPLRKHFKGR
jgi:hypothetical protein